MRPVVTNITAIEIAKGFCDKNNTDRLPMETIQEMLHASDMEMYDILNSLDNNRRLRTNLEDEAYRHNVLCWYDSPTEDEDGCIPFYRAFIEGLDSPTPDIQYSGLAIVAEYRNRFPRSLSKLTVHIKDFIVFARLNPDLFYPNGCELDVAKSFRWYAGGTRVSSLNEEDTASSTEKKRHKGKCIDRKRWITSCRAISLTVADIVKTGKIPTKEKFKEWLQSYMPTSEPPLKEAFSAAWDGYREWQVAEKRKSIAPATEPSSFDSNFQEQ